MNMAYSLPLVVLLCGYVYAAKSRYDDFEFNNAWPLTRRGGRCFQAGQECIQSSQCCYPDACVVEEYGKAPFKRVKAMGTCRNLETELGFNSLLARKPSGLPAGSHCDDSSECDDLCCRVIHHFRGTLKVCGEKDGPFMCIKKSKGANDVYYKK
ncbi:uncharacterized protein LOC135461477 isoform X2 [Liolophura sinensis]|uniref:uncharacterized protein LOC135461477 isoform X2 n=1 Tax=Liolophura sinensis TaxID=3198878 RepID=UPI003158716D